MISAQMAAHGIERFFGIDPPVHREQIVGHEEEAYCGIGGQPVHELLPANSDDRCEQMG